MALVITTFQRRLGTGWSVNRFVNALYTTGRYSVVLHVRGRGLNMNALF